MGLYRFKPAPSGRMGILWALSTVRDAAVIEYGCMGHMLYAGTALKRAGISDGCRMYSTHITETDISLGEGNRFKNVIDKVITEEAPKAVFLTPSSIPEVIGTDITAISRELQPEYPNTKLVPVGCGGFDKRGAQGVQEVLNVLVRMFPEEMEKTQTPSFNIIGSCADMFRFGADAEEISRLIKGAFGADPICILTSDTDTDAIERLGSAHFNIVIRREGKEAARYLEKKFHTSFHYGRPYGVEGTLKWLEEIAAKTGWEINRDFLQAEKNLAYEKLGLIMPNLQRVIRAAPQEASLSLGGHADVVRGILNYGCGELNLIKGICWCDSPDMAEEEIPYFSEEQWADVVLNHKKGWFMGSGEALEWSGKSQELQISNPDNRWRIYPFEAPFMGFRGAVNLACIWINHME